ncbi:MAG TPA: thioredoxin family protein [Bacteroidota bacterium]|nr:thioredoxin family protein [Bacteroidota bacterium]
MVSPPFDRMIASALLVVCFALLVKAIAFARRRALKNVTVAHLLPFKKEGATEPTLLYFWNTGCSQCPSQERQIEEARTRLSSSGRSLTVLKLNALEEELLARQLHVMTVPTTILLDADGKVAATNPGLTPWQRIVEEFHSMGEDVSQTRSRKINTVKCDA